MDFMAFMLGCIALYLPIGAVSSSDHKGFKWFCVFVFFFWLTSCDYVRTDTPSADYEDTKVLVSTAPSHTQVSGGFVLFWGSIGTDRVYLLREEVSEGLYKDFEVHHEVFIKEDDTLTNTGLFTQEFTCTTVNEYYKVLFWKVVDTTEERCKYVRQIISVPTGSVIKNISI